MDMQTLLATKKNLALVVGNGINRYGKDNEENSWESLLLQLAKRYKPKFTRRPEGVSLTEFYDVLELEASTASLQKDFCELISSWKPFDHHRRVVEWAVANKAPILTTNFERVLADCAGFQRYRTMKGHFTAHYPWETYFGAGQIDDPCSGFGIWHINGTEVYRQSIRLGLSHYMGSVQRARSWLHSRGKRGLLSGNSHKSWRGSKSWLQVIFSSRLLIFGLGLGENEVFLRWLLIERARYFRKFPARALEAWYIQHEPVSDFGKKFFLEGVGVKTIEVSGFDAIYGESTWK